MREFLFALRRVAVVDDFHRDNAFAYFRKSAAHDRTDIAVRQTSRNTSLGVEVEHLAGPVRLAKRCMPVQARLRSNGMQLVDRNLVTTPKLPPPPRIAQKRSGSSSALTRRDLAIGCYKLVAPKGGCRSSARIFD